MSTAPAAAVSPAAPPHADRPRFSVCIPNYNYEKYLGRTVSSVLGQATRDLEVVVADNASTDGSLDVLRALGDPRIRVFRNACNVGFAHNLDRAVRPSRGRFAILLSSDDLMRPDALARYGQLLDALGPAAEETIFCSACDLIDPHDAVTGRIGLDAAMWRSTDRDADLTAALGGVTVYRVAAEELLRRSLRVMRNPLNFCSTCYPRALYDRVEGYGGGRMINPDKWYHWRLLGVAQQACFIDAPCFAYRWHPANQSAQQAASGALKYLADEYASTLELEPELLARAGLDRAAIVRAFVEYDVARHGLATLGRGQAARARRILRFGQAAYPAEVRRSAKAWALWGLTSLGPLGTWIAGRLYRSRSASRDLGDRG